MLSFDSSGNRRIVSHVPLDDRQPWPRLGQPGSVASESRNEQILIERLTDKFSTGATRRSENQDSQEPSSDVAAV